MDRNHDSFTSAGHCENVMATVNTRQGPTTSLNNFGQARDRRLASHGDFQYPISFACLSPALLREQPTFDSLTNIRAYIVYCFALRHASRQCRHFRPKTAFFCFVNQHL